jgi:glycosyltransferase involved in cell wall biosynthesis
MSLSTVEVLLATYNGEKYLGEQISSILTQTFQDFRILVSDDGSTDRSLEIIGDLANKYPQKIMVVDKNNSHHGVVGNFSDLIERSSSPYLMPCDQDDIWFPNKIQVLVEEIQSMEEDKGIEYPSLVHSDLTVVNSSLEVIDQSLMRYSGLNPNRTSLNQLLVQNVVTGASCIFNRCLADLASPIPGKALMHDWWIALIASSVGVIGYLDKPTGYYRQHSGNVLGASSFGWKYLWDRFKLLLSSEGKGILADNIDQAAALLSILEGKLEQEKEQLLEEFCALGGQPFIRKRWTLLKHKFLKGKPAQNFGLLLGI